MALPYFVDTLLRQLQETANRITQNQLRLQLQPQIDGPGQRQWLEQQQQLHERWQQQQEQLQRHQWLAMHQWHQNQQPGGEQPEDHQHEQQQQQQQAQHEQQNQHPQQDNVSASGCPTTPVVVVKEEPRNEDENNDDSGVPQSFYTSSEASPSNSRSPPTSVSPPMNGSFQISDDEQNAAYDFRVHNSTRLPVDASIPTPLSNEVSQQQEMPQSQQQQQRSRNRKSNVLTTPKTKSKRTTDQTFSENMPIPVTCPICNFSSTHKVMIATHLMSHCSVKSEEHRMEILSQITEQLNEVGVPKRIRNANNAENSQIGNDVENNQAGNDIENGQNDNNAEDSHMDNNEDSQHDNVENAQNDHADNNTPDIIQNFNADNDDMENNQNGDKTPIDPVYQIMIYVPKIAGNGNIKTFKCKQCPDLSITKVTFWEHSSCHMKKEKIMQCPHCPFVTEYKHHMEYHVRNHFGTKPFKCFCGYTCVSKSMLTSHKKSHSNLYPYRCRNCGFACKYCHQLKDHLRKHQHKDFIVLNPDGTPNPYTIVDVNSKKRGPKAKVKSVNNGFLPAEESLTTTPVAPTVKPLIEPPTPMVTSTSSPNSTPNSIEQPAIPEIPLNPYYTLSGSSILPHFGGINFSFNQPIPSMNNNQNEMIADIVARYTQTQNFNNVSVQMCNENNNGMAIDLHRDAADLSYGNRNQSQNEERLAAAHNVADYNPLDLSTSPQPHDLISDQSSEASTVAMRSRETSPVQNHFVDQFQALKSQPAKINRRKGRAIKLNKRTVEEESDENDEEAQKKLKFYGNTGVVHSSMPSPMTTNSADASPNPYEQKDDRHNCQFCSISFANEIMFNLHMSLHRPGDPFTCNVCGLNCSDGTNFYLHISEKGTKH